MIESTLLFRIKLQYFLILVKIWL